MKKIISTVLLIGISALVGAGIGILLVEFDIFVDLSIPYIIFLFFMFIISYILQTMVHEGGHLVFGLLSGYTFSSYRIFNIMLMKEDGKFIIKKYSLAGTAGQCIMNPPEIKDGKIPVFLYNMGGCFMNIIVSACCLVLATYIQQRYVGTGLIIFGLVGILFALLNGIPMGSIVNNDGMNTITLLKDKDAVSSFYLQFKVVEQQVKGIRIKDLDPSLFEIHEGENVKNKMIATKYVLKENYLMDQQDFDAAYDLIMYILDNNINIVDLHKKLLVCDYIYVCIVRDELDKAKDLLTKDQVAFMKQMKDFPTVIRCNYVYSLCILQDKDKASSYLEQFDTIAKKYPYKTDIDSERELIEYIQTKAM